MGICGSAGGVEALQKFFEAAPESTGLCYLVVLHLAPKRESHLAELLSHRTCLPVEQARDQEKLRGDHIYVIPPNAILSVDDATLKVRKPPSEELRRRPADALLRSIAYEFGSRGIGVLLSGSGSDGAVGLQAIKEEGGLTLVQDPGTAQYESMPRNGLANAAVDQVLPPERMPNFLQNFIQRQIQAEEDSGRIEVTQTVEAQLREICRVLRASVNHDFNLYKKNTMLRRIHRRMLVNEVEELQDYVSLLHVKPEEASFLFRELLISVTGFFRDSDAYDELSRHIRDSVIPQAVDRIRVWVPACATGEEVYSLAILLVEAVEESGRNLPIQLFATDIDERALRKARSGRYPEGIADRISPERLQRFFTYQTDHYLVNKELRGLCLFSRHNLVTDPPFSNLNLVSCRNFLIYLEAELQSQVIRTLHYGLIEGGVLFLGNAESLSGHTELFHPLDKSHRIFSALAQRNRFVPRLRPPNSAPPGFEQAVDAVLQLRKKPAGSPTPHRISNEVFQYLGLTIVVFDDQNRILESYGHPDQFFAFRAGIPENNLLTLCRDELRIRVRTVIHGCRKQQERCATRLRLKRDGETIEFELAVLPGSTGRNLPQTWFAIFRELGLASDPDVDSKRVSNADPVVVQLESELESTRQNLQCTVEELEASNEELRSSNEELLSMNEELQSSNEELETSKEELQSVNEEMETVNYELQEKMAELDRAHADLRNLFESTPAPTVFLDRNLCVQQFTPATRELFNLIPSDLGRPILDITFRLKGVRLEKAIETVLKTSQTGEYTLTSSDEPIRHSILRILPYRNLQSEVEGVVLSFYETTRIERARMKAAEQVERQRELAQIGADALRGEELHSLIKRALGTTRMKLGVRLAVFLVPNGNNDRMTLFESAGWRGKRPGTVLSGEGSFLRQTLKANEPVLKDMDSDCLSPWEKQYGLTQGLGLALKRGDDTYGCLLLYKKNDRFSADDGGFLLSLGNILLNAQLKEETSALSALSSSTKFVLSQKKSVSEAIPEILRAFHRNLDVSVIEWWQQGIDGRLSCDYFATPENPREQERVKSVLDDEKICPGESLVGRVFSSGQVEWVQDIAVSQAFKRADDARELGLSSAVAIPVLQDQNTLGVVVAYSQQYLSATAPKTEALLRLGRVFGEFTRRIRAEETLRLREAHLHNALKKAPIPLCIVDEVGEILVMSEAVGQLTGFPCEELRTLEDWTKRAYPSNSEDMEESIKRLFLLQEPVDEGQIAVKTEWGDTITWHFLTAPLGMGPDGRKSIISMAHDVTEREKIRLELEQASERKDEFLAMLGHELRNPLAAIRNCAVLLMSSADLETELGQWAEIVARQSDQMTALLDGLLDLTRISKGKVHLDKRPYDLVEATDDCVKAMSGLAEEKTIELSFEAPEGPLWAVVDLTRWTQIVENLLSNAIKYTPAGGAVKVSLQLAQKSAFLEVVDNGKGLPREALERVFEAFHQEALDGRERGLGLGLALVKHLVESHHGEASLYSEGPGLGTTSRVVIPALGSAPAGLIPSRKRKKQTLNILLVEDENDIMISQKALFEKDGHRVRGGSCAEAAMKLFREEKPAIVLCDLHIEGDRSGFEVVREMKALDPTIPVVAVTGFGLKEDREKCLKAGFDGHLTKPLRLDDFYQISEEIVVRTQLKGLRVLVIDDNPIVLRTTEALLKNLGLSVVTARGSKQALSRCTDFHPEVFFIDWKLDEETGEEVARSLQERFPKDQALYVLVSGESMTADLSALYHEAHVKPLSYKGVLEIFGRWAEKKQVSDNLNSKKLH